jgi:hypothetical protein
MLSIFLIIKHYAMKAYGGVDIYTYTLGRRLTTDFRSDWQVVSRAGRMSAIYLLTVFLKLSNLFIIFIIYF